ncbi:ribosome-inactivating family protein [Streptomyces sp. NPDC059788]|uniref:ribosome-inactivating family protein n=1 Tax=Streptomyces sp. NPDC059788 TaxID=3346948 RepID=UPI00366625B3
MLTGTKGVWWRSARTLLVTLLAALAFVGGGLVSPPQAHAATNNEFSRVYFDITGWNAAGANAGDAYASMINDIRHLVGQNMPRSTGAVQETTTGRNRLIEVHVMDNGDLANPHRLSLFFWAHNLYMIGISSEGRNYSFRDVNDADRGAAQNIMRRQPQTRNFADFAPFAFNGSYTGSRGLDRAEERGGYVLDVPTIVSAARGLGRLSSTNDVPTVRRQLTVMIAAIAEGARFGWISHRIEAIVRNGAEYDASGRPQTTLGGFGVGMETDWSDMTRWARGSLNGSDPSWYYVDDTAPYRNVEHMLNGAGERNMHYFLGLGGSH